MDVEEVGTEVEIGGIMAVGAGTEVEIMVATAVAEVAGIGGIVIHGIVIIEEITVVEVAEEDTAIGEADGTIGVAEIGGTTKVGVVVMVALAEVVWIGQT